ncbi:MAG: hypothetical protein J1E39_05680 [Eubacterium sp.]|nr:hypothetical protein [Eubacterium sp.]
MKIVYFIETVSQISGVQAIVPEILANIPEGLDIEAYYINFASGCEYEKNSTSLRFIAIDECDFSQFEDAVFMVPANYLMFLLPYIADLKNARICLYVYDSLCYKRMLGRLINPDVKAVTRLFDDNGGLFFLNKSKMNVWDYGVHVTEDRIIPQSTHSCNSTVKKKNDFDPNEINIGWIGPISTTALDCITRISDDLYERYYPEKTEEDEEPEFPVKINFHIIGLGSVMWNMDFPKYSPLIRYVYTGNLDDEHIEDYIRENLDLAVGYNLNAVRGAMCGVPTVIPAIDDEPKLPLRKYVYFHDARNYILCWNKKELRELNNASYTLPHIIEQLSDERLRREIAEKCEKTAYENYSYVSNVDRLRKIAENSDLTVEKCIEEPSVRNVLDKLWEYRESINDPNASYSDYYNSLHPKTVTQEELDAQEREEKRLKKEKFKQSIKGLIPNSLKYPRFYKVQRGYKRKERAIRKKYKKNGKIKVGFIVVFNSVFPERPVFEKMLEDNILDPYIIIAPNVSRTYQYLLDTYYEAYDNLSAEYPGRVVGGYDEKNDEYLELKDEYSVIFFANPYKHLVHPFHEIEYFVDKNVLTLYANYGLAVVRFWEEVIATDFYNLLWRVCIETPGNLEFLKSKQKIKGKNGIVTGCLKMDKLDFFMKRRADKTRKMIMICPHHTVWGWKSLNISNFLDYYRLFIELPKMYPDIDFVFRPHPLLFPNLIAHKIWTQEQIDEYLEEMLQSDNIIYDTTGDYHEVFAASDAMIHDCGSFTGEYLYTEKPCCYMLKKGVELSDTYIPLGEKCLENYYHAYSREDILSFIEDVVINGNDPLKEQRTAFSRNELQVNYPHTSEFIIELIKKKLT